MNASFKGNNISQPTLCISLLILIIIFLTQSASATTTGPFYNEKFHIVDRAKNGAQMLADDIEFIALSSFTTIHIAYNLYLHPKLTADASLPQLNPKRILAEERMVSSARDLCAQHLRINDCHVFFWKNLADIPSGNISFLS